MKKTYISPEFLTVELNCGRFCESLIIGSGQTEATRGNGTDLVKEENTTITNKSVWDNEW